LIIPARKLVIVTLRDHERRVIRRLGELGVVQLRRLGEEDARRIREAEADKLRELEELSGKLIQLWQELSRLGAVEGGEDYRRYIELRNRLEKLYPRRDELRKLKSILKGLRSLGEEEIPVFHRSDTLFSKLLMTSRSELSKLADYASKNDIAIFSAELSGGEYLVHLIGLGDKLEKLQAMLESVYHEEVVLPASLPRSCREALAAVEAELDRLEDEIRSAEAELRRLKERIAGFVREDSPSIPILTKLRQDALRLQKELLAGGAEAHEELSIEEASKLLENLLKEYRRIRERLASVQEKRRDLEEVKKILEELLSKGVKKIEVGGYENLSVILGLVKGEDAEKARQAISEKPAVLKEVKLSDGRIFLLIACLKEYSDDILTSLKSIGFEEFTKRLEGLDEDLHVALEKVDERLKALREDEKKVLVELEKFRRENAAKIASIARSLELNLRIEEALMNTLRSEELRIIQGWVSEDKIPSLTAELNELRERIGKGFAYRFEKPRSDEEAPTALKNPKIFKVFESLVAQYGWPGYREVDPTIISGILWTLMFGLMFPDLGQGIVIIGLGIFFSRVLKGRVLGMIAKKIGRLMIWLGVSASFFGLLFGEFFLTEVQPLAPGLRPGWLEDPSGTIWLLKIAIFFGIAQIILAMSISAWNELKHGEIREAIFSHHGVAGIIAFIGFILTAFHFLGIAVIPGVLEFPELGMKALQTWPFYLMLAGFALMILRPIISKESFAMNMGNLLEIAIAFLANTFSYARIAGFAIVHAALAMVVHRMLHANLIMGIGMGLIFLNLFALSIELLVCMIQALRLLYYEFYSKFYRGMGRLYTPWRLR